MPRSSVRYAQTYARTHARTKVHTKERTPRRAAPRRARVVELVDGDGQYDDGEDSEHGTADLEQRDFWREVGSRASRP